MQNLAALDDQDPLAGCIAEFVTVDPDLIYLDGNSLGRLPRAATQAMETVIRQEWGEGLVRSWRHWVELPMQAGNVIARIIGADSGDVLVTDQTSVNLYKLAWAAVAHQAPRNVIVTDRGNFPSDRYILDAVATHHGGRLRVVDNVASLDAALNEDVALVSLSHVAFKEGTLLDLPGVTRAAHGVGAMMLWDLSHSAGAVSIELAANDVDLAVGCTYKYLNGGPGSPAYLYVRSDLQDDLTNPMPGWFGHTEMFEFAPDYVPAPGIARFAVGTPPIIQVASVKAAAELVASAGIEAIRRKSIALTSAMIELADAHLVGHGFEVITPREPANRGSHVAIRHEDAYRISQAMIRRGVIPDFRTPDVIRLGLSPLTTRFRDLGEATERLKSILDGGEHESVDPRRSRIT